MAGLFLRWLCAIAVPDISTYITSLWEGSIISTSARAALPFVAECVVCRRPKFRRRGTAGSSASVHPAKCSCVNGCDRVVTASLGVHNAQVEGALPCGVAVWQCLLPHRHAKMA